MEHIITSYNESKISFKKNNLHINNIYFDSIHRGVVAVSMDILQLDINQCDDSYYVPNAFKGTHKCDAKTSYVSRISLFL